LKLTWPHPEATHEHLALRYWAGRGAVRLLTVDPPRWALLLERLDPDHDLGAEPIFDACKTIGTLLAELDRPAPAQLERLSQHASRWVMTLQGARRVLPQRFLVRAGGLAGELAADPGVDARMVHTDLHFANVLAGGRQPWLAIDPKPLAAEPAFAVAPALWNRWPEAAAADDTRGHLRRRLEIICESAGIDPDRAMAWTLVREAVNAVWAAAQPDSATPARIAAAVTIMKAMQP
jgi:streptomycin 6-kinase